MIANVSHCFAAEIEALRLALRHKEALEHLGTIQDAITLKHGLSFGAVWTVYHVVHRVGIEPALKLFAQRTKTKPVSLFLYDATSRMENRLHVRLDQQWPFTTFGSGFSEGDRNKAVAQTFTVGESGVLAYVEMVLSE
jgi:hypothetical protein